MSRTRSTRGAAASRPAARAGGGRVLVQTPRSDIYVVLLAIALGAIVLGCLLELIELNKYEFQIKATAGLGTAHSNQLAANSPRDAGGRLGTAVPRVVRLV